MGSCSGHVHGKALGAGDSAIQMTTYGEEQGRVGAIASTSLNSTLTYSLVEPSFSEPIFAPAPIHVPVPSSTPREGSLTSVAQANPGYYVSGDGQDQNDGLTPATAFRTLQRAADLTQPGDTVYVMNGTYTQTDQVYGNILSIQTSGTPDQWITYQAFPTHHPKLEGRNWHAIEIQGASYIRIEGFELDGNIGNTSLEEAIAQQDNLNNPFTSGNGISVGEGSHHVLISRNHVHDYGGGGMGSVGADYVTIENNVVHDNALYSPYANSGISYYQNWNSDNNVTDYKMIIRRNVVYNNRNLIPFFVLGKISDGNGIIIDDSRNKQFGSSRGVYQGKTLIENNIVYNNGGRAIHVFDSDRVDITHNTAYQNSQHPDIDSGEITASFASQINVVNNIIYASDGLPANSLYEVRNVVYDYNLIYNTSQFDGSRASNIVGQNPQFVDPTNGNFSLQPNSPAIDQATSRFSTNQDQLGHCRPFAQGADMGAIEYGE